MESFLTGANTFGFKGLELRASLLAIANGVEGAEWYLLASGQQEFLTALHEILLIERPWIHEILQHDHEHVPGDVLDGQTLRKPAGLAGERHLADRFWRGRNRRRGPEALQGSLNFKIEIRHHTIGYVVEVVVNIDDPRKGGDLLTVNEGVSHRIASRKAAGDRNEVAHHERP